MQLKAAKIIARGRVRRPAEEGREGSDVPDVCLLTFSLKRRAVVSSIMR
jgi:hypothetical protein